MNARARQLTIEYRVHRLACRLAPAYAVARALRTAGAITVADYLTEVHGLRGGFLRSVQTTFGKRVKQLHIDLFGRAPKTAPVMILSGKKWREIDVCIYRPAVAARLFDQIWREFYAQ
jgi:hypothetical protein